MYCTFLVPTSTQALPDPVLSSSRVLFKLLDFGYLGDLMLRGMLNAAQNSLCTSRYSLTTNSTRFLCLHREAANLVRIL